MKIFKNPFVVTLLLLIINVECIPQDFKVDGIYYNILSTEDLTVEVANAEGGKGQVGGSYADVVIPQFVTYRDVTYSVTRIGKYAFYHCINLYSSFTIPNWIKTIGDYSFANSKFNYHREFNIPEGVTSIGEGVFMKSSNISNIVVLYSVDSVGSFAFYEYGRKLTVLGHLKYVGFELEYLESLPQYVHIDLNIFRTYRDTLLGRIMGDMI